MIHFIFLFLRSSLFVWTGVVPWKIMRNSHVLELELKQPLQGGESHTVGMWGKTNTIERRTVEEGFLLRLSF